MEPERRMCEALRTIHGYADRIIWERRERGYAAGLASRDDDFLSRFAASGEHSDESLRDGGTWSPTSSSRGATRRRRR